MCRFGETLSVSDLDVDADCGLVWVVDVTGQVWFTTSVSAVQPEGSGRWWQVMFYSSFTAEMLRRLYICSVILVDCCLSVCFQASYFSCAV